MTQDSISICESSARTRQDMLEELKRMPESDRPVTVPEFNEEVAKALYNLPGRRLALAQQLARTEEADTARDQVARLLAEMVTDHDQILDLRNDLKPDAIKVDSDWLAVSASVNFKGVAYYYKASLLRGEVAARLADLSAAATHLLGALRLRAQHQPKSEQDANKTLHMLCKVLLLSQMMIGDPGDDREWRALASDSKARFARASGVQYRIGPPRPDEPPSSEQQLRDQAYRTLLDVENGLVAAAVSNGDRPALSRFMEAAFVWMAASRAYGGGMLDLEAAVLGDLLSGDGSDYCDVTDRYL